MRKFTLSVARVSIAALAMTVAVVAIPVLPGLFGLSKLSSPTAQAAMAAEQTIYTLNTKPFKQAGRLYLPLREVAPLLDLHLTYNSSTSSYQLTGITQTARFKAGDAKATSKSNTVLSLGAAVIVKNGVTYVPATLFSKLFSIPITFSGGDNIRTFYNSQYLLSNSGDMLFWLNRTRNVLYGGQAGAIPSRLGTIHLVSPDWLDMKTILIDKDTYVLEIGNSYGEPHIFNDRVRALIHKEKLISQASITYGGPSMVNLAPDALKYKGKIIMNYGHYAELVSPDGTVQEQLHFGQYGTADEVYSLEAVEEDFFLIRPYTKGTLLLVDRSSGTAVPLYLSLLSKEAIDEIERSEWGVGDGLTYIGRTGDQLKFSVKLPYSSQEPEVKLYTLARE